MKVIHGKNAGWWCMTEKEIIKWLLDGDPANRWQVMSDLPGEDEASGDHGGMLSEQQMSNR